MKKLFLAMLATETDAFSPLPTGWNIWRDTALRRRGALMADMRSIPYQSVPTSNCWPFNAAPDFTD